MCLRYLWTPAQSRRANGSHTFLKTDTLLQPIHCGDCSIKVENTVVSHILLSLYNLNMVHLAPLDFPFDSIPVYMDTDVNVDKNAVTYFLKALHKNRVITNNLLE